MRIVQKNEMEKSRWSGSAIENHAELTEHQMALSARVRGILRLVSSTSGNKRMEFVNRDFSTAINIRRFAVLETRAAELRRSNFVWKPRRPEVYIFRPADSSLPVEKGWESSAREYIY